MEPGAIRQFGHYCSHSVRHLMRNGGRIEETTSSDMISGHYGKQTQSGGEDEHYQPPLPSCTGYIETGEKRGKENDEGKSCEQI